MDIALSGVANILIFLSRLSYRRLLVMYSQIDDPYAASTFLEI